MKITTNFIKQTKRHLSASGSILLPLALKWRLVGVAVCGLSLLGAGNVSAASITLSTPSTLSVNVTPSTEGTFAKSKSGSISVTSDAYAGYTLTVKGKADNNALTSGGNSLPSITETAGIDENTFNSTTHNNKWGYRPSKKDSTENTKFFPGPKLTGDILDKTNPSSKQSTTTNYTVELGVRVDNNQPAGIYTGTFVFTAAANDLMYSITYDGNGDGATDTPSKQTGSAAEGTAVTIGKAPTRDKYVFMGWCSQETKNETCDGEVYQPNGTYKLINGKNELNLHAMWARIMQNWDGCNTLAEATTSGDNQISLIDTRDNKLYYVAKLADGNCWMTENLDLDIDQNKTYTKDDTDLGYASDDGKNGGGNGSGTYTWKPSESTHPTNETGANHWKGYNTTNGGNNTNDGENTPQSYDPGNLCWNGLIEISYGSTTEWNNKHSIVCEKHQHINGSNPHYHLGNYYNYAAAVAQNNTKEKKNAGDHYDTSICPAGWQLPPYDGDKSYQNLSDEAESKGVQLTSGVSGNVQKAPYYLGYNGRYRGALVSLASSVHYFSNAVSSVTASYFLRFEGAGTFATQYAGGYRLDGMSVRCVARR